MEPLIKDTLNEGHLCIKDTSDAHVYSGNTFLPLNEDNLSIMDQTSVPICLLFRGSTVHVDKSNFGEVDSFSKRSELPLVGFKITTLCSLDEFSATSY